MHVLPQATLKTGWGGAISAHNSTLNIEGVLFEECFAGESGGGITSGTSNVTITRTRCVGVKSDVSWPVLVYPKQQQDGTRGGRLGLYHTHDMACDAVSGLLQKQIRRLLLHNLSLLPALWQRRTLTLPCTVCLAPVCRSGLGAACSSCPAHGQPSRTPCS